MFNGDLVQAGSDIEYELALGSFIFPLLDLTGLSTNDLFFVPGNHDINRAGINTYVDGGLANKFSDREKLNQFIDHLDDNASLFKRLQNYADFVETVDPGKKFLVGANRLQRAFVIEHSSGLTIGLAALNSAWVAEGDKDYGNILIGERQVDWALEKIQECKLKIAMVHHPLDWLAPFDRDAISRRLVTGFDLICTGHVHEQHLRQVVETHQQAVFLQAGSLFQGRSFNGYSILTYNGQGHTLKVQFREYSDRRREFHPAESLMDRGVWSFGLGNNKNIAIVEKNLDIKQAVRDKTFQDINKMLISSSPDTIAPKDISHIFIPPYFSHIPETLTRVEEKDELTNDIDAIVKLTDNVLFLGRKESGKTTLLNYIFHKLQLDIDIKVPFLIDFRLLPTGRNIVQKALLNFLHNYDCYDFPLEINLEEGNCVILVDNLDLNDTKKFEQIKQFCSKYPRNRFIFTTHEGVMQTIDIGNPPDLGCQYTKYHLYSFRRGQVRQLTQKWFNVHVTDVDILLDRVMLILNRIGIPRTPLTVSLVLWILEKQDDFVPLNEAALLEKFVEILLEKLNLAESGYNAVDYQIKADFLGHLAQLLVMRECSGLTQHELDHEILSYFDFHGLDVDVAKFKGLFFKKGILVEIDKNVYFRHRCFFEYFVARYMGEPENLDFKNYVLAEERYLRFVREIGYMSGLSRKDGDLLTLIESRLVQSFEKIDQTIDIASLSDYPVSQVLRKLVKESDSANILENMAMTDEEKDALLELGSVEDKPEIGRDYSTQLESHFIQILELYGQVLRNSELLPMQTKIHALEICINKYTKLIGILFKFVHSQAMHDIVGKQMTDEEFKLLRYLMTVGVPLLVQSILIMNVGTPKLRKTILSIYEVAGTDFERLMMVSLYGDLRLHGYIGLFEKFIKSTESELVREIALMKLIVYNMMRVKSKEEQEQLVRTIRWIITEQRDLSPVDADRLAKELRKHNILNMSKTMADK